MEILVLLGVLNVLAVLAFVFWPKREPPDLDWKSCVKKREEEEKRRRDFREKAEAMESEDSMFKKGPFDGWNTDPIYADVNPANMWNTAFDDD